MSQFLLKWSSPVVLCLFALATSGLGQQTGRTPPPVSPSEQAIVKRIKALKRQIDDLMGKLPPKVQDELRAELARSTGPPSPARPREPRTRPLPREQEATRRKILSLKAEMAKLAAKLPPHAQTQLKEMAQPPESLRKPGGHQPSGPQLGTPRPSGTQPRMPQPGARQPGRSQFGRTQPVPSQSGVKHSGPASQQPLPPQTDALPPEPGQPALLIDGECAFVSNFSMGQMNLASNIPPPLMIEVEVGRIPSQLFGWMEDTFAAEGDATRSGEVHAIRTSDSQSIAVTEFHNAHLSSVTLPAFHLETSSTPGPITVVINPESRVFGPGNPSCQPVWPNERHLTSFRVTLDGLPTDKVVQIGSFTLTKVTNPELELSILMNDFPSWENWLKEWALYGVGPSLNGDFELLASDLSVLATIKLEGVTPISYEFVTPEAVESLGLFRVRLNVNAIEFR